MPWVLAVVLGLGANVRAQDEAPLSLADGEALDQALTAIVRNVAAASARQAAGERAEPRMVVVTERAVNGYLRFQGASLLPPGVGEPRIRMQRDGRLTAHATVDLDTVRDHGERGVLDPLRYLSGIVPVRAVAVVRSTERAVAVDIESVAVGSVPVPRAVLLDVVRHYTRSDRHPDGVDLSQAFPLPSGIEAVRVEERQTVVVQ